MDWPYHANGSPKAFKNVPSTKLIFTIIISFNLAANFTLIAQDKNRKSLPIAHFLEIYKNKNKKTSRMSWWDNIKNNRTRTRNKLFNI